MKYQVHVAPPQHLRHETEAHRPAESARLRETHVTDWEWEDGGESIIESICDEIGVEVGEQLAGGYSPEEIRIDEDVP